MTPACKEHAMRISKDEIMIREFENEHKYE